jgi:xanthine/uracil permease
MSKAQKLELGLFYAAITLSGAVYALYELHQMDRLVHALEELMPPFIFLVFVLVICGLFRMAASVLKGISGVCQAAHATLYARTPER